MLLLGGRASQGRSPRNEEDQNETYEGRFAFSFLAFEAAHESSSLTTTTASTTLVPCLSRRKDLAE